MGGGSYPTGLVLVRTPLSALIEAVHYTTLQDETETQC